MVASLQSLGMVFLILWQHKRDFTVLANWDWDLGRGWVVAVGILELIFTITVQNWELFPDFKFILGPGHLSPSGWDVFLALGFAASLSGVWIPTLASFLYHAVQNGTSNLDRQRGWIYLLVYLLVIKGKEMNSQTGIWDFSSTQAHVPFSLLSKQMWQEKAILVCYSWSSHTHL